MLNSFILSLFTVIFCSFLIIFNHFQLFPIIFLIFFHLSWFFLLIFTDFSTYFYLFLLIFFVSTCLYLFSFFSYHLDSRAYILDPCIQVILFCKLDVTQTFAIIEKFITMKNGALIVKTSGQLYINMWIEIGISIWVSFM